MHATSCSLAASEGSAPFRRPPAVASAIARYLSPVGGDTYRDFALLNASRIGNNPKTFPDTHGSPLLGMGWTALDALPEPVVFRQLMDHNRRSSGAPERAPGTIDHKRRKPHRGVLGFLRGPSGLENRVARAYLGLRPAAPDSA